MIEEAGYISPEGQARLAKYGSTLDHANVQSVVKRIEDYPEIIAAVRALPAEGVSGLRLTEAERRQLAATISQNLGHAVNAIICENIARQVDAILADRLAAHPPEPEASEVEDLVEILAEHRYVNGQQVGHICRCGWFSLTVRNASEAHRAHVAQVIADTYLPAVVREAEASARAEIERLTRERDEALDEAVELAAHVGTQAAWRAQAENERDEWKQRRDNAIELCRFRHQDGLTAEEWHTRICGAMRGVQEERARAERAEAALARAEARALREAAEELKRLDGIGKTRRDLISDEDWQWFSEHPLSTRPGYLAWSDCISPMHHWLDDRADRLDPDAARGGTGGGEVRGDNHQGTCPTPLELLRSDNRVLSAALHMANERAERWKQRRDALAAKVARAEALAGEAEQDATEIVTLADLRAALEDGDVERGDGA